MASGSASVELVTGVTIRLAGPAADAAKKIAETGTGGAGFVKVTDADGVEHHVNPDHIVAIHDLPEH